MACTRKSPYLNTLPDTYIASHFYIQSCKNLFIFCLNRCTCKHVSSLFCTHVDILLCHVSTMSFCPVSVWWRGIVSVYYVQVRFTLLNVYCLFLHMQSRETIILRVTADATPTPHLEPNANDFSSATSRLVPAAVWTSSSEEMQEGHPAHVHPDTHGQTCTARVFSR